MVLVCVTDQESCNRLIIAGRRLADAKNTVLKTICVRPKKAAGWLASEEVESLYTLSKQLHAEMVVLFNDSPVDAISDFIRKHATQAVIVGTPLQPGQSAFISGLEHNFPNLPLLTADPTGQLKKLPTLDSDSDKAYYHSGSSSRPSRSDAVYERADA